MNDNGFSKWHIIKEKRESEWTKHPDGSPEILEVTFIRRDDGLTVERIGLGRAEEMIETFLCKSDFEKFKFEASRWDLIKAIPLDIYTVFLYSNVKEPDLSLALSHLKDIESALLNYPIHNFFNNMPVKNVIFYTGDVRNPTLHDTIFKKRIRD